MRAPGPTQVTLSVLSRVMLDSQELGLPPVLESICLPRVKRVRGSATPDRPGRVRL